MNPGEGPSGSQIGWLNLGGGRVEPDMPQLDLLIRHMLLHVGFSAPLQSIIERPLKNQGNMQVIDNIQKQYYNLCYAYHELCAEFTAISQQIHYYQSIIWNYQSNPAMLQQINEETHKLNTLLEEIENEKTEIIQDMLKIHIHFNEAVPIGNNRSRGRGTRGQGTRGGRTQGRHSGGHGSGSGN